MIFLFILISKIKFCILGMSRAIDLLNSIRTEIEVYTSKIENLERQIKEKDMKIDDITKLIRNYLIDNEKLRVLNERNRIDITKLVKKCEEKEKKIKELEEKLRVIFEYPCELSDWLDYRKIIDNLEIGQNAELEFEPEIFYDVDKNYKVFELNSDKIIGILRYSVPEQKIKIIKELKP